MITSHVCQNFASVLKSGEVISFFRYIVCFFILFLIPYISFSFFFISLFATFSHSSFLHSWLLISVSLSLFKSSLTFVPFFFCFVSSLFLSLLSSFPFSLHHHEPTGSDHITTTCPMHKSQVSSTELDVQENFAVF